MALKLRARSFRLLDAALVAIVVLHWLSISAFPHWWAGHSFGPRFFTDVVPYLVYSLLPVLDATAALAPAPRAAAAATLMLLFGLGAGIHLHAATSQGPWRWNDGPPNVDDAPARVWDWRDLQVLRRG